ncbi:FAD-dependent oxidoreductase [Amycolatopsis oliviviridis]|uniref:Isorenieratene synthase n=1 Tax=Amycolatopsis oliviviridis TaxID=1471590 RepID=A0ABQ3M066_9PSEU|nr:NAD(P)/FAD-dependent oxidoreductase [Amycolatopsis oliviviridis]GHH28653.1 isorenieratene synthase [Amycolatopsis oliviviridis]
MTRPRDPRIVTHPASPGLIDAAQLGRRPTAAIVGAGIAGLTAATGLAERGVAVTVFEREDHLGGRVGGWREQLPDGTPVTMSRGFHAFFRQYYNLRALLKRTDPRLDRLTPLTDYPLLDAHGRVDTFAGLPRTPPWNAVAFALRSPTFTWKDLLRLDGRNALPLATVSVPETYHLLDRTDAASFLESLNFPDAARHLAFEVFSRSFFAEPHELSAAELATMFHLYFLGSSEGLLFDVPNEPFPQALWDPLAGYLTGRRVELRTGTKVDRLARTPTGFTIETGDHSETFDGVVLACDIAGLREIVEASPDIGTEDWRAAITSLRIAPPFLVRRLWLDRPVGTQRPPFLGTGSVPPLDNISVLDRYEGEARRWAARTGGSVVELHAYAATTATADILEKALDSRLHEIYPETRDARVVGENTLWRQDCPLFGVGDFEWRPTVETPETALALAGDGIRVDLPVALMERAATTGWVAANSLLQQWGLAGHPIRSVPNHGRIRLVNRLDHRVRARGID